MTGNKQKEIMKKKGLLFVLHIQKNMAVTRTDDLASFRIRTELANVIGRKRDSYLYFIYKKKGV